MALFPGRLPCVIGSHVDKDRLRRKVVAQSHSVPCPRLMGLTAVGAEWTLMGPYCPWEMPGPGSECFDQSLRAGKGPAG